MGVTETPIRLQAGTADDITVRLLTEGTMPLVDAAREAGLCPVPSLRTLLRAAAAERLESLKVAGRRVTSAPAIGRWIAAQQRRETASVSAAGVVLGRLYSGDEKDRHE